MVADAPPKLSTMLRHDVAMPEVLGGSSHHRHLGTGKDGAAHSRAALSEADGSSLSNCCVAPQSSQGCWMVRARNIGYHIEHHWYPSVPFYNLPQLHARLAAQPELVAHAQVTRSVFASLSQCTSAGDASIDR